MRINQYAAKGIAEAPMKYDLRDMRMPANEVAPRLDDIGPIRREPIALDPSMSVMEAFAAVMRGCVTHIATAAEVARRSDAPEGIHQLRVGIRRLRAAFSVFGPALPLRRPAVIKQLHSLQQRLGAARELDVLVEETMASMPNELRNLCGMGELARATRACRGAQHRRARAALASRRCTGLLAQLGHALNRYAHGRAGEAAARALQAQPITAFTREVLRSRYCKACKLGDKIRDLGPAEVHELRIRVKKLRYATEFFRDLLPHAQTERYLRALKDLQQVLGTAHDAVIASSVIARVGKGCGPDAGRAAVRVQDWVSACVTREARKLPGAWRRFAKSKPRGSAGERGGKPPTVAGWPSSAQARP
jgi:CHAD domain-containing protein